MTSPERIDCKINCNTINYQYFDYEAVECVLTTSIITIEAKEPNIEIKLVNDYNEDTQSFLNALFQAYNKQATNSSHVIVLDNKIYIYQCGLVSNDFDENPLMVLAGKSLALTAFDKVYSCTIGTSQETLFPLIIYHNLTFTAEQ